METLKTLLAQKVSSNITYSILIVTIKNEDFEMAQLQKLQETFGIKLLIHPLKSFNKCKLLNYAASKSVADFMWFSDSDILYSPRYLQNAINKLKPNSNDIFLTEINEFLPDNSIKDKQRNLWFRYDIKGSTTSNSPIQFGFGIPIVRRQLFLEVGGYDTRYAGWGYEDKDLIQRLCRFGSSIQTCDPSSSHYAIHQYHTREKPTKSTQWNKLRFTISNHCSRTKIPFLYM